MNKKIYNLMNNLFDVIGHPPFILITSIVLFASFFIWIVTDFNSHFYEILHLFLAIITLIIALVIEGSERSDTAAIQHKLDEIIKAMPEISNSKAGIEHHLKAGNSLEDVIKKTNTSKRRKK